jgi:hypothetical protein
MKRPMHAGDVLKHRYADGLCPDEIEGWDTRDPLCWACKCLDRTLAAFNALYLEMPHDQQPTGEHRD